VKCDIVNPEIYMNGKILPANVYLNADKFEK